MRERKREREIIEIAPPLELWTFRVKLYFAVWERRRKSSVMNTGFGHSPESAYEGAYEAVARSDMY